MDNTEKIVAALQDIQLQLREIKAASDLDRRNTRSLHDNLAAELTRQITMLDAKFEIVMERVEDRLDQLAEILAEQFAKIEARLGPMPETPAVEPPMAPRGSRRARPKDTIKTEPAPDAPEPANTPEMVDDL